LEKSLKPIALVNDFNLSLVVGEKGIKLPKEDLKALEYVTYS